MKVDDVINALSIDLEYWYSAELVRKLAPDKKEDQVIEAVKPILNLLDEFGIKATFFVLGSLAEKYGSLIGDISDRGHEIASHGYSHTTLYDLDEEKFEDEIVRTNDILKSITGKDPIGFRAPTFSINNSTRWALRVLIRQGYKYDSSIFPIKTGLYGVPDAPVSIYKPSENDLSKHDPKGRLIEFPPSVIRVGRNLPVAGGFYARAIPGPLLNLAIKKINRDRPAIIYLHPWETYERTPVLNLPLSSRFITYYGIKSMPMKLRSLMKNFSFAPVREVIQV